MRKQRSVGLHLCAAALVGAAAAASAGAAVSLTPLGDLPGRGFFSEAYGVSADGSVVVGRSDSASGGEAFRYSGGVMTGLGDLPGGDFYSVAWDVSGDGSVIVGQSSATPTVPGQSSVSPFRYSGGVMIGLGHLPGGTGSVANGVSNDGSVIVGFGMNSNGRGAAFRYSGGVMTELARLPGSVHTFAFGVSGDGSVVVGYAQFGFGPPAPGPTRAEAFRYSDGVMTGLGHLPGGSNSIAYGISDDGSVIVGAGNSARGAEVPG